MEEFVRTWLFNDATGKIVAILLGAIVIWLLKNNIGNRFVRRIKGNDNRYRSKKLMDVVSWFLIALMVTIVYSNKLGGLTVALGVAGAGIAFALQEVIASVAGWLAVMFGGFYKTGDRVQLGGIKGDVIDIGVLRTTVMEIGQWVDGDLYNGRIVRIANSFVFKEPVFNYSGDFPFVWDEIKLPITFGSDYDAARELFQSTAEAVVGQLTADALTQWRGMVRKFMIEDAQLAPAVTLQINDNWVEYTVRYVAGYKVRRITKNELFTRILKAVEATNGRIKFASATFQLVGAPALKVELTDGRPR